MSRLELHPLSLPPVIRLVVEVYLLRRFLYQTYHLTITVTLLHLTALGR